MFVPETKQQVTNMEEKMRNFGKLTNHLTILYTISQGTEVARTSSLLSKLSIDISTIYNENCDKFKFSLASLGRSCTEFSHSESPFVTIFDRPGMEFCCCVLVMFDSSSTDTTGGAYLLSGA